jgi:hypothetical protein
MLHHFRVVHTFLKVPSEGGNKSLEGNPFRIWFYYPQIAQIVSSDIDVMAAWMH